MFDQENNEQNEQEKFEEARRQDNVDEQDSDYFSFDRVRERALGSEYGTKLSKDDKMDDTGNYKFETGDALNLEEIYRKREKLYTYSYFKDVINSIEADETSPHLEDLEKAGVMTNIRRRVRNGVFLGFDFKKDNSKTYVRLLNRRKDPQNKITDGFEYSKDKNNEDVINLFKMRLREARRMYETRPSGMIEAEICSELSDDDTESIGSTGTVQRNGDDDDQGIGGIVRYDSGEERVSFDRQEENRELGEVIEQEVEKTKFELIEEVELDMQGNRDHITAVFSKLHRDNDIEPFDGTDYLENIENVMKPISEMQFSKNPEFFRNNNLSADDVYDQQMKFIEDNIKDIDKRITAEEAKGDGANKVLIKAYKELRDYLDLKIDSLNVFFERPVKAEYFKRRIRRLVKKNARLTFERGKRWIKAKFPEFLAGIVVSVGSIVFSVYELAEAMGKGIVEQGQKALKNLGKKIIELAAKQEGVIGTVLHAVGSFLEHGADGLDVLRDHFIAVSIIIILLITGSYYTFRHLRLRVKKKEHKAH